MARTRPITSTEQMAYQLMVELQNHIDKFHPTSISDKKHEITDYYKEKVFLINDNEALNDAEKQALLKDARKGYNFDFQFYGTTLFHYSPKKENLERIAKNNQEILIQCYEHNPRYFAKDNTTGMIEIKNPQKTLDIIHNALQSQQNSATPGNTY